MINGAEGETRTRTPIQHSALNAACLPIPTLGYGMAGAGGFEPLGLRFWRPSLYQLSYAPIRSNMND